MEDSGGSSHSHDETYDESYNSSSGRQTLDMSSWSNIDVTGGAPPHFTTSPGGIAHAVARYHLPVRGCSWASSQQHTQFCIGYIVIILALWGGWLSQQRSIEPLAALASKTIESLLPSFVEIH